MAIRRKLLAEANDPGKGWLSFLSKHRKVLEVKTQVMQSELLTSAQIVFGYDLRLLPMFPPPSHPLPVSFE